MSATIPGYINPQPASPTFAGWQPWCATTPDRVNDTWLPLDDPQWGYAWDTSVATVTEVMAYVAPGPQYLQAVYNLALDNLINFAQDPPDQSNFENARLRYGLAAVDPATGTVLAPPYTVGLAQSASDTGTSSSIALSDSMKNLSLEDLRHLKTPYGRRYLELAQQASTDWGLT